MNEIYQKSSVQIRERFKDHVPRIMKLNKGKGKFTRISWKKPDTSFDSVVYFIDHKYGTVSVYGDLGDAIYQWKTEINLDFLADCYLDYFNEKCRASSDGTRGKVWNSEVAYHRIKSIAEEIFNENAFYAGLWVGGYLNKQESLKSGTIFSYSDLMGGWQCLNDSQQVAFKNIVDKYISNTENLKMYEENSFIKREIKNKEKHDTLIEAAVSEGYFEHDWHKWLEENGEEIFGDCWYEYADIGSSISGQIQYHLIGLQMIKKGFDSGKFKNDSMLTKFLRICRLK